MWEIKDQSNFNFSFEKCGCPATDEISIVNTMIVQVMRSMDYGLNALWQVHPCDDNNKFFFFLVLGLRGFMIKHDNGSLARV